MVKIQTLVDSVDNFIAALCYTYHADKRELMVAVASRATAEADRLAGLDPDRNK